MMLFATGIELPDLVTFDGLQHGRMGQKQPRGLDFGRMVSISAAVVTPGTTIDLG